MARGWEKRLAKRLVTLWARQSAKQSACLNAVCLAPQALGAPWWS